MVGPDPPGLPPVYLFLNWSGLLAAAPFVTMISASVYLASFLSLTFWGLSDLLCRFFEMFLNQFQPFLLCFSFLVHHFTFEINFASFVIRHPSCPSHLFPSVEQSILVRHILISLRTLDDDPRYCTA